MPEVWIVNASPVITLAKINRQQLLETFGVPLIMPDAVAMEISAGPAEDPGRILVETAWGERRSPSNIPQSLLEWGLGNGETAVLGLALEIPGSFAVLDDAAARTAAKAYGMPLIGTLGVVLRAKTRGLIDSASDVIRDLQSVGLRLDHAVIRMALENVGESWPF